MLKRSKFYKNNTFYESSNCFCLVHIPQSEVNSSFNSVFVFISVTTFQPNNDAIGHVKYNY
jgi:hypothetical protein